MIELTDVSRTYESGVPVRALDGVSVSISEGDYVSVTGRSGSGKSTLLNVLGLLDRPDGGRYTLQGLDVGSATDRKRTALRSEVIGFVFQRFHLLARKTSLENVELGLAYQSLSSSRRRELAFGALDRVGLAERVDHRPSELSGGEQQRVAIARATAGSKRLVLCDEPTGNLDSRAAESVLSAIESLNEAGTTVVVVTHDPRVAERADYELKVLDGKIAQP